MLEVVALSSLRYDTNRAGDLGALLAPPYDVIDEAERAALESRSAYNAVHLILPRGEGDAKYARAAEALRGWRARGVLRAEPPALWLYRQSCPTPRGEIVRSAILCGVRLRPYEERTVLPHERTHAAPKEDRYRLKMATRAHLSPFLALYDDAAGEVGRALTADAAADRSPDADARTPDGQRHRLTRLRAETAEAIGRALAKRHLIIADGHHRYDTMLRLHREIGSDESGIGFGCIVRLQDEGLVVWPTHRLALGRLDAAAFLARSATLLAVEERPLASPTAIEEVIAAKRAQAPSFALVPASRERVFYLSLRVDADVGDVPAALRNVEAALLEKALAALGPPTWSIAYTHDAGEALARLAAGEAAAAFILGPARVSDVLAVAEAGLSMPQKSTFFHPKVPTGLLFHPF
ncbi:MAG: DUF1015 domain-containing protein [Myxococcota bacterium]